MPNSVQSKLTALLHELQHARSPLARARVMARAWRTVRELSSTDRWLLARNAGFDGAEELLDGLAKRRGGLAPDKLLRVLANARATDGSAVSELLATLRDPGRHDEAIALGVDLVSDVLADPSADDAAQDEEEVREALGELQAVERTISETPEEARPSLETRVSKPDDDVVQVAESTPDSATAPEIDTTPEAASEDLSPSEPEPVPPLSPPPDLPSMPPELVIDWGLWEIADAPPHSAPEPRLEIAPSVRDIGSRRFEIRADTRELGAEPSVIFRLRDLRRGSSGLAGSSIETLRELIESFPDGWVRRRALCALYEAGIPADIRDSIELVDSLSRETDRRWCLGLLARRGALTGSRLDRALELVSSASARRRLERTALQSASQ